MTTDMHKRTRKVAAGAALLAFVFAGAWEAFAGPGKFDNFKNRPFYVFSNARKKLGDFGGKVSDKVKGTKKSLGKFGERFGGKNKQEVPLSFEAFNRKLDQKERKANDRKVKPFTFRKPGSNEAKELNPNEVRNLNPNERKLLSLMENPFDVVKRKAVVGKRKLGDQLQRVNNSMKSTRTGVTEGLSGFGRKVDEKIKTISAATNRAAHRASENMQEISAATKSSIEAKLGELQKTIDELKAAVEFLKKGYRIIPIEPGRTAKSKMNEKPQEITLAAN